MENENRAFIEMTGITKRFPGVVALDDVSLTVKKGRGCCTCRGKRRGEIDADENAVGSLSS